MRLIILKAGRLKGKALLLCMVSILFIFLFYRGVHNIIEGVSSIEIISLSYPGKVIVQNSLTVNKIHREISKAKVSVYKGSIDKKFVLVLKRKSRSQTFWFNKPGQLFEVRNGKLYELADKGRCLEDALRQLEQKNPFGEFLAWSQVRHIFKKYDKAKIIDFETGMSFRVQRRAGSQHADVQPLTADDSDVMKMIYGGKWSWKRRAVIIETGGRRLAGSMNGMPHGAGAIGGNKFNGHFCIHFRDSKLHSNREDPAHQLMVWKAAGVIDKVIAQAEPAQAARAMLTALEQGDANLALKFIETASAAEQAGLAKQLQSISWIASAPGPTAEKSNSDKTPDFFPAKVSYRLTNGTQYKNRKMEFRLVRSKEPIPWKVSSQDVQRLFDQSEKSEEDTDQQSETTYNEGQFYLEL